MYLTSGHISLSIALAISAREAYALAPRASPSTQDWTALNKTVGGRLGVGEPWSKPCFSEYDGARVQSDPSQCKWVQDNYFNQHLTRTDAFGAWSATQWETCMATGDTCELNWANSTDSSAFLPPAECKQGSVPPYYIDVKDKDDVVAALQFAKKTKVPLVVKNTGHDFQGRSSAKGGLALWTHHLKNITLHKQFVPEGCPPATVPATTISLSAGDQFQDIYTFADSQGLVVVGGSDQSVGGGGGWILGGGHSSLSPTYGMGVDRVMQFKVVTPDGVYRTVNACQNEDLFFALRGGGGNTFGVLLETTVLASPSTTFRAANINWNPSDENYAAFLKVFVENATTFAKQGWGGYITPSIGNAILTTPKLTLQEAQESMKALIDATASLGKESNVTEIDTYLHWFQGYVKGTEGAQDSIGLPIALASRLIPQNNTATPEARAELINATVEANKKVFFSQLHVTTPYGFNGTVQDSAINPVWRTSLWQMIMTNTWDYGSTLADRKNAYAGLTDAVNILRKITPNSGAYHNEADIHEPNHEVSFWGSNYPRLVEIKSKYDPDHIFDCWHCVGSKGENDPRFSCYI